MFLSRLQNFIFSFSMKLFIGFWFIAIISIVGTRYISMQLLDDDSTKVKIETIDIEASQQLKKIAQRLKRRDNTSVAMLLKNRRWLNHGGNIWLKAEDENYPVQSAFLLRPKQQKIITSYIKNSTQIETQTVLVAYTHLTGPLSIKLEHQNYKLYISKRQEKKNFSQLISELPVWIRLTITLTISFILSVMLARSFSKPVLIIKEATEAIANGNLSTRVNRLSTRKDELGELAKGFNFMAEQLACNVNAQQRLLGDVSHELRSPLTRLNMALALIGESSNEAVRQQYLQRCLLEVSRLDEMLAEILVLSRLENAVQQLNFEQFDFTLLLKNIIKDAQFIADEKNISIELSENQNMTNTPKMESSTSNQLAFNKIIKISADSALLTSAISNVFTNAIKYSPVNTIIQVVVDDIKSQDQHFLSLHISDQGPGVPEQALEQLFTAFYRVNNARDRDTGGTGLGLAIAKQAILAHKGTISAKNKNNLNTDKKDGLTINITLPL